MQRTTSGRSPLALGALVALTAVGTLAGLAGCSGEADTTSPTLAPRATPVAHYTVDLLPALGGSARGNALNERGWVGGFATLGDGTRHAALWRHGAIADLGTLGGPNSNVQWPGLNDRGWVVGIAETAELEPNGEEWSCASFFPAVTHHVCRGFVWKDGFMAALPTFGGPNGFATGVNNRGQVVGWAETAVHDPTCNAPQVLQFRAALWEPTRGTMRELRPLPGDSTSAATAINARGQVVGISGDCDVAVGEFSAKHAVLWDADGTPHDIGSLGGEAWHTPMDIDEAGDVVGFSNPTGVTGGVFDTHAFLWTAKDGMRDLGVLPGDEFSEAFGINAHRQIVGISCGDACHPVLWQDGAIYDLNTLLALDAPGTILSVRHIDDTGRITGNFLETSTGRALAFTATPTAGAK